jgi:hypothetical protein
MALRPGFATGLPFSLAQPKIMLIGCLGNPNPTTNFSRGQTAMQEGTFTPAGHRLLSIEQKGRTVNQRPGQILYSGKSLLICLRTTGPL